MLREATVGLAQWLPAPGKLDENLATAVECIRRLGTAGCDLIVLPEMWPCGYDRATLADDVRACALELEDPVIETLAEEARAAHAWLAAGSVPEAHGGSIYNTGLLFDREGKLRACYRKAHLYSPAGEDEIFTAGDHLTICSTDDFGDIGLVVCFDGDFPEVARSLRLRGARLVVNVSAYELAAASWWDRVYRAHALVNGQWWIMANQCGTHPSGTLLGGSQILSPFGEVIARARVAEAGETPDPELLVSRIDLQDEIERADAELSPLLQGRRPELY
jgi:predicted amidohydrolase